MIYLHANGEDIFDTYALTEALSKYLNVTVYNPSSFN